MFKYHTTPLLDHDIAHELQNAMLTQEIDHIPWILRSQIHNYWRDELTEKYPNLIEFTLNWFEMNIIDRLESDDIVIGNVFAIAQYNKGDFMAWHHDSIHRKAIVVFLDDRTEEDGSFFEFENKPWDQKTSVPEEKDIVRIVPKFNTWVEMDNPDYTGCMHRVSPNLSGKPRLAMTIFMMNNHYSQKNIKK